ncbi:homeobox protein rough sheath 1 isoform X2 [Brachypodium distachyon]|uniref:ELK domain-containing protein n=1 Tax=Brachypodium distachyon TaxID=15368 RepID=A0A2K2DIG8_BRADI|nr:homeobox protein rough sheath 1 isoform X2 [Brachypodium distachyon]PNT74064.1 hypothetical protein BRADI_1g07247v3 [Brachypodium distachyon]|eukprot:XP_014751897.2 homeobox protein rough sheath 1 isoform X2 [Brachypodium distachyon]
MGTKPAHQSPTHTHHSPLLPPPPPHLLPVRPKYLSPPLLFSRRRQSPLPFLGFLSWPAVSSLIAAMERFRELGGGGGSSSSSAGSMASFLHLPLRAAASSPELIPPAGGGAEHHGSRLALHQLLSNPPPSTPQRGHHKDGEISPGPDAEAVKAKIMAHPLYSPLLASYLDCHKVGAPPDVLDRLSAVAAKQLDAAAERRRHREPPRVDPELDQFMEAYCNMLAKYREELARPIWEATEFFRSVETQLDSITDSNCEGAGSSEDDLDTSCAEEIDPSAEDRELKHQLLRKYGGYVGSLRQEFCKRRKKGKLPKEARQKLLQWWELHCKWPYPSVRDGEDRAGGVDGAGPEADQQLVHQPAEAALEAGGGGHAVLHDGRRRLRPRPAGRRRRRAVHGGPAAVHVGRHVPAGFLKPQMIPIYGGVVAGCVRDR